jgi:hypothetical protein
MAVLKEKGRPRGTALEDDKRAMSDWAFRERLKSDFAQVKIALLFVLVLLAAVIWKLS